MVDLICWSLVALIVIYIFIRLFISDEANKLYNSRKNELEAQYGKYRDMVKLEEEIKLKYEEIYRSEESILEEKYRILVDDVKHKETELEKKYQLLISNIESHPKYLDLVKRHKKDIEEHFTSPQSAYTFLAKLITDYLTYDLMIAQKKLSESMSMRLADKYAKISVLSKQLKDITCKYYSLKYEKEFMLSLYPKLEYMLDTQTDNLSPIHPEDNDDPVKKYLSDPEYISLSENERNQRALDNYISSHKKTNWEIGRDYEMYVGYRMRNNGFSVEQTGISDKLEDLGRDIIAHKNGIHYIIQCKYWSSDKVIREKHIAQLYGTGVCYALENKLPLDKVKCVFYTNIDYSDMAMQFANALSVKLISHFELDEYPRIKCKVNYGEFGKTYIYHLPMDQQYDATIIKSNSEDMYAFTVEEAVSNGFRRAYRWHMN